MFKSFWSKLAQVVALLLLFLGISLSPVLAQETGTPETQISPVPTLPNPAAVHPPESEIQSRAATTVEPKPTEAKPTPATTRNQVSQPRAAYDMEAIQAFDDALYGS